MQAQGRGTPNRSDTQAMRAVCPLASLAKTWFLYLPRESTTATSSLFFETSIPTQRSSPLFIASDLPRMRAWRQAAGPSYRSVLLSEETVGSTHLTHGVRVTSAPKSCRCLPGRPDQRRYS